MIFVSKLKITLISYVSIIYLFKAFILVTYSYSKIIDAVCKESELSKDEEILKQIILTHYIHLFYLLEKTDESYKTGTLIILIY